MAFYRVFTARTISGPDVPQRELKVTSGRFEYGLNKAGSCRLSIPKRGDSQPLTLRDIEPELMSVWIQRDSQLVWGGIIWDVSSSRDSGRIELVAEEFPSLYDKVLLESALPLTGSGTLQIVQSLVTQIASQTGAPYFDMLNTTGSPGFTYVPQWHTYDDRTILSLVQELQKVGQHTQALGSAPSSVTEGFEWTQVIRMGEGLGFLTRASWAFWPGRAGTDKDWPVIESGPATRNTARSVSWSRSGRESTRRIKVVGFGTNGSDRQTFTSTHNPSIAAGYPWHSIVFQDTDIRTNQQAQAVAVDRLNRIAYPLTTIQAEMVVGPNFTFGSVDVGDRLWTAVRDWDVLMPRARLRCVALAYRWGEGLAEVAELDMQPDIPTLAV